MQSNGIPNPAYLAPASTPGQFSQFVYLYANSGFTLKMSLNAEVQVKERLHVGFRVEAINFLNHPFFALGSTGANNPGIVTNSFGQVSSASGNRAVLLRAFLRW